MCSSPFIRQSPHPPANMDKRRRLSALQGLKGISDEALCAVLHELKGDTVVEDASAWELQQFLKTQFRSISCTLQMPTIAGPVFDWEICQIGKLLRHWCAGCDPFREVMDKATAVAGRSPDSPLNLVLYLDGITPGNVLRPDNKRKIWAFYATFMEIGREHLCHEECWIPLAVLRSSVEHDIVGRLSSACRALMGDVMQSGSNGVFLPLAEPAVVFFRFSNLLADEEGLKLFWNAKGASGSKPCMLCRNLLAKGSDLAGFSPDLIEVDCTNPDKFIANTDADVWRSFDRLDAANAAMRVGEKGAFEVLQRAVGFTYNPHGILADMSLRGHLKPATTFTYDWMHVFLSNGIGNFELQLLLKEAKTQHRVTFKQLDLLANANWKYPAFMSAGKTMNKFFSAVRQKSSEQAETFKAMASEMLMVYPLVRQLAYTILENLGGMDLHLNSFYALGYALDLLHAAKRGPINIVQLQAAISLHGDSHQRAYGTASIKPKHHYAHHIPKQIARDNLLLDTFVLERKHQPIKRCADHCKNTVAYERSVLSRVIVDQTRKLCKYDVGNGLAGKRVHNNRLFGRPSELASGLRWCGGQYQQGDVVIVNFGIVFEIQLCVASAGELEIVGRELQSVRDISPCCRKCTRSTVLSRLELEVGLHIEHAQCWSTNSDGSYVVCHSAIAFGLKKDTSDVHCILRSADRPHHQSDINRCTTHTHTHTHIDIHRWTTQS
jgi:hypothetical protein